MEMEMNDQTIHFMGIPPKNFRDNFREITRNLGLEELK